MNSYRTVIGLLLILILGACGNEAGDGNADDSGDNKSTSEITGSVSLYEYDSDNGRFGEVCYGATGYSDIRDGAEVVVKGADGNTVAVGSIDWRDHRGGVCGFDVSVSDVPMDEEFYEVQVAGRGGPTYTRDELAKSGWMVDLTFGDNSE